MVDYNYNYQHTKVKWQEFETDTGKIHRVVAVKAYTDSKGILPNGIKLTLQIQQDNRNYPEGKEHMNMAMNVFSATVLTGSHQSDLKKGDYCQLEGFRDDISTFYDGKYYVRFDNVKKIQPQQNGVTGNAPTGKETTR